MFYRVHLCWAGFELTTLVVIGTDCIGSYKSNYHTITATLPYVQNLRLKFFITGLLHFTQPQIQPRFCEDTVIVTLPPPPPPPPLPPPPLPSTKWWFPPPNKTFHDITEILLKVALSTISQTNKLGRKSAWNKEDTRYHFSITKLITASQNQRL